MTQVAVIDYGMGNLHSIHKALQHADPQARVEVTSDPQAMRRADRVVFPGVGAIRDCMAALRRLELASVLEELAAHKPFLGICLGMQALLEESEENEGIACLGLLPGRVKRFPEHLTDADGVALKIPHMGWNQSTKRRPTHCGKAFPKTAGSILCIVTMPARTTGGMSRRPPTIRAALLPPWSGTISLRSSFIRKKAKPPVSGCWPIFCNGTLPSNHRPISYQPKSSERGFKYAVDTGYRP